MAYELKCGTVFVNKQEDRYPSTDYLPDLNEYVTADHELTYIILREGKFEAVYKNNTTWYGFNGLNVKRFLDEWSEKLDEIKKYAKETINSPDGRITITRIFSGHRFTDQEVADLFAGKEIEFQCTTQYGNERIVRGKLAYKDMDEGKAEDDKNRKYLKYWGFIPTSFRDIETNEEIEFKSDFAEGFYEGKQIKFRNHFKDYKYTEDDIKTLLEGKPIFVIITNSNGKKVAVRLKLIHHENNYYKADPDFRVPPVRWAGHDFTLSELEQLYSKHIIKTNLISSKGNIYPAELKWEDGRLKRKTKDGWK